MESMALRWIFDSSQIDVMISVMAMEWVQDGIDAPEVQALEGLAHIALTGQKVAIPIVALPWVRDGIEGGESEALLQLSKLRNGELVAAVSALEWMQDGITETESEAILQLGAFQNSEVATAAVKLGWMQDTVESLDIEALQLFADLAWVNAEFATILLDMPFMETLTPIDLLAVDSLWGYAGRIWSPPLDLSKLSFERSAFDLERVLALPPMQSGITDDIVPVVAVLRAVYAERHSHLIPILFHPTQTRVERRTITTPLAVEVELAIVRTRPGAANRMDYLEHAVRTAEDLVGAPFPVQTVILFYEDLGFGGANFGTFINILPAGDVADEIGGSIMHEVAHYYKLHGEGWVTEGVANAITAVALERLSGRPLDLWEAPCPHARTIAEFETLDSELGTSAFICHYALGERIFMDLYRSLGEERFRQGMRNLFLGAQDTEYEGPLRGIRHVAEAFGADDAVVQTIVARWYDGSAPYDTSRLDASPVDPSLTAVNGRVADAYVAVDGGGSPAATFTAGAYERLALVLESGGNAQKPLDLEVVEYYEDGFAFARHTLTLDASPHAAGATGRVYLRKGGADVAPGTYYIYVYDGDRKVAEAQYTITA